MSVYIIVFLVALHCIGFVLLMALRRPKQFCYSRNTIIQASAEKIFPFINDLRQWSLWSPYEKLDATMQKTFAGSAQGVGAIYEWKGNAKAGHGRMEIVHSLSPEKITLAMIFLKPFRAQNTVEFSLVQTDHGTLVSWAMFGNSGYLSRVIGIFVNMDKLIGKEFASGLANLKIVAELTLVKP